MGLGVDRDHLVNYITPPIASLLQENGNIEVLIPSWIVEDDLNTDLEDDLQKSVSVHHFYRDCSSLSISGDCKIEDSKELQLELR